jgi:hypothetical protein
MRVLFSGELIGQAMKAREERFQSKVRRIHDAWETLFEESEEKRQLELFGNNEMENQ